MDSDLQDRLVRGWKVAARIVGVDTDVYRPSGAIAPLASGNRVLRLRAAFSAPDGRFAKSNGYGDALWQGLFDASQTQQGDYLTQATSTWFIAAQHRLLPVLCVRVNRTVSLWRPAAPSATGANAYGGVVAATNQPLLKDWPASVLGISGGGHPSADLPADVPVPYWTVLLPALPNLVLRPADLMTDDLGRSAVVSAAELSELGWRITAKQATT